jgi:hypothetical protein
MERYSNTKRNPRVTIQLNRRGAETLFTIEALRTLRDTQEISYEPLVILSALSALVVNKANLNQEKHDYFAGTFFRVSTRKSQNFCTVAMFTFSSGECGKRMVGPKEIISHPG